MKKLLMSLVTMVLCCSFVCAAFAAPSYLNMESNGVNAPMVNEGETVTLDVVISQAATQGKADQIWLWKYFEEYHNIKFNVEQVADAAEYKNLAFASGDIPDMIINMGINTADLVTYGAGEGMLLPIDEYMAEYMPNLSALYAEHPEWREAITAPDGHIYGLGAISDPNDETRCSAIHYNEKWLKELGLEKPATVEDFIHFLRAAKAAYGDEAVPFNGGYKATNPCLILLTAYGWKTNDATGLSVALKAGTDEVVFPYGDREGYTAYLKTMNTLYSEGLMSHDFYTLDGTAVKANVALGIAGTYGSAPWAANPDVFMDWDTLAPLTSEVNDIRVWPNNTGAFSCNRISISADTEYPELCCKFADFFFNEQGVILASYGPFQGGDADTYGMTSGWYWDEKINWLVYPDVVNDKEGLYGGMENPYRQQKIMIFTGVQMGDIRHFFEQAALMAGVDYQRVWSLDSLDFRHYATMVASVKPYFTDCYPSNVFFTEAQNERMIELKSVINAYVESETAKFVTGARPLTEAELDNFYQGLEDLDYPEYLRLYIDYYENYTAK